MSVIEIIKNIIAGIILIPLIIVLIPLVIVAGGIGFIRQWIEDAPIRKAPISNRSLEESYRELGIPRHITEIGGFYDPPTCVYIARRYIDSGREVPDDIKQQCIDAHARYVDDFKFNPNGTVEIKENGEYRMLSEEDTNIIRLTHGEYFLA